MNIKKYLASPKFIFGLAFFLRLILVFVSGYHPDILNHVDWGRRFWLYGPQRFYQASVWSASWPNQPPGTMYLFAAIAKVYQFIVQICWWLNLRVAIFPSFIFPFLDFKFHIVLLKIPFLFADLGIGWLIYRILFSLSKSKKEASWGAVLFLFNPPLIYNSAVWGQTDSLVNFLALLALWLIYKQEYYYGVLAFGLSLYFKLSLIIWLPILLLIFLFRRAWKSLFAVTFLALAGIILLSLPFVGGNCPLFWLWHLYHDKVFAHQGAMLSGNAFNLWTLLYGVSLSLKDTISFLGVPTRLLGQIAASFLVLIISFRFWLRAKKTKVIVLEDVLLAVMLISFAVFLFLTGMHERYLYPLFAPLAILVVRKKLRLWWYLLLSLIHWINLYNLWWYPPWPLLTKLLTWHSFIIARGLSFCLLGLFGWLLFIAYNKANEKG